ncbi:MAG: hypothetical protein ABL909_04070 [Sphingopyxis sp.]
MIFGRENGPLVPYGAAGVAVAMAALLGVTGVLLPTALTESVAFQLYLDTIVASAVPPFGWLAKIATGMLMALVGGLLGLGLARLFGVRSSGYSVEQLLARLRGVGRHDDDDAPTLRPSDRHPDAPARRPFSAATDIPARDMPTSAWDRHWQDDLTEEGAATDFEPDQGDDDELLLDSHFADSGALIDDDNGVDPAPYCEESTDEEIFTAEIPARSETADSVRLDSDVALATESPVAVERVEPLDLSIARLDELLARLEAGLASRRSLQSDAAKSMDSHTNQLENAAESESQSPSPAPETGDVIDDEQLFPQDPALAAALATLRRMNQHVGQ